MSITLCLEEIQNLRFLEIKIKRWVSNLRARFLLIRQLIRKRVVLLWPQFPKRIIQNLSLLRIPTLTKGLELLKLSRMDTKMKGVLLLANLIAFLELSTSLRAMILFTMRAVTWTLLRSIKAAQLLRSMV